MHHRNWKKVLQEIDSDPDDFINKLNFEASLFISKQANKEFPMRVPASFLDRINKEDPDDPLLRQVLPTIEEEKNHVEFTKDPLLEFNRQISPGLLHKYYGRVLLVLTGACAIHCRYCFRRYFPYSGSNLSRANLNKAIEYLKKETSVTEVILSGGDPLSVSDDRLSELVTRLEEIPHLKRLRIHTRFPIIVPERINDECLAWLSRTRLQLAIVLHVNHANELDKSVEQAMLKLRDHNIPLFNQSVLLKGVNDTVQALVDLSETLFAYGVIPYYLHLLDPVAGASHFKVDESAAKLLMNEVQKLLPGYLLPKLVKENPESPYKIILT